MNRLSTATLAGLPADVGRPPYDRTAVTDGVVHLGVGAFHQAHQAVVFDTLLGRGDCRWGITGASLRSPEARDRLGPQDGLYTVVVHDGAVATPTVIGALRRVLVAPNAPAALVAALAAPTTHLVTLTITEKGYDPVEGPAAPTTAAAYLVAALARRRAAGLVPFTALSCDNLADNGGQLAAAVLDLARARDPALADWIARHGAFPATMVDRVVPATEERDIAAIAARLGVVDRAMVKTEPFSQWVIEDRFAGQHPDFAAVGVTLTDSVVPWETAKLRLLNGTHSALAYLGGLAGIAFVDEAIADPGLRGFVVALMDEAAATLVAVPGLDLAGYRAAILTRLANPALRHRTAQIAIDGSRKLPPRLLAPLIARLDAGRAAPMLTLAVAAWMAWIARPGARVDDPLHVTIARHLRGNADAAQVVAALLAIDAIFPARLRDDNGLRAALIGDLTVLRRAGVAATIAERCPG